MAKKFVPATVADAGFQQFMVCGARLVGSEYESVDVFDVGVVVDEFGDQLGQGQGAQVVEQVVHSISPKVDYVYY